MARRGPRGLRISRLSHLVVGLGDDEVLGGLDVVGLEVLAVGAQLVAVERGGLDTAATEASAGCFRVVVGVAGNPLQLERAVLQHEREHLGTALEIGVDAFGSDNVADDAVQVGTCGLRCIGDTVRLKCLVVGDPDPTTGTGGRSAVVGGFLHDDHTQALVGCGQGRCHTCGTTADDDDVVFLLAHVEHVIE